MVQIEIWQFILIIVITILLAAVATFFITRKIFAKQLQKNPPINSPFLYIFLISWSKLTKTAFSFWY